ncbi:methionyl-tRNA formyltransferase [bacterium]|nr:methionyl-tRNA formyltransferase [bacterium]
MIKVVFLGTPDIAVESLSELCRNSEIDVCAVVTQPDRPKGRGNKLTPPPVKVCAQDNNICCYQTERISKDTDLIAKLKEAKPDFLITFAFGQILSQEVLDIPKFATINLHASLLPKYRGANPIQRCIYNGDCKTGITTMLTVLELDAGDICETEEINISETMTDIELKEIISKKSPELLFSTIKGLYCGTLKPHKQPSEGISIAKKFIKSDGLIDWNKTATQIHNQIRSMVDFPTAYTFFEGKMIKIIEAKVSSKEKLHERTGEIVAVSKTGIEVTAKEGIVLITKVKPESKGIMNAFDFANGAKIKAGMKFGE